MSDEEPDNLSHISELSFFTTVNDKSSKTLSSLLMTNTRRLEDNTKTT